MYKKIKYSQNFLTNQQMLNQIINQINLNSLDTIYELGTGKGHLTSKIAKKCHHVYSIELDNCLFEYSTKKFQNNSKITLLKSDILLFNFPKKDTYKIVGNIPYSLSTKIIKKIVFEIQASEMFLVVEYGFYKRLQDTNRTLGLLLQTQVDIQKLLNISANNFHPKPKVNSVLIQLKRHPSDIEKKHWQKYKYFVSKWVNHEYRNLFTKNQLRQAKKHAKIDDFNDLKYEQIISMFNSYLLFNPE
ncbi:23S ribosomal RNA methyltransferase Erm [Facklamia sp. DSM 111018]|uniref:rRNA adenine N-6-methyltransferase n=1 Tax=Facklamia lactis TaxID=2749967 RepID=A0ABS0LN77_9LACT|nr:23S ribosomal RNA methyltransferase Erm [Facklamia lactis]MBG9979710.1 23S ribosomal RNA methyltransferase Erm [Facklamia lactis]MBG9985610.1 23S ribosomal RNA methyltransferase Erm [Facklamia lactis]